MLAAIWPPSVPCAPEVADNFLEVLLHHCAPDQETPIALDQVDGNAAEQAAHGDAADAIPDLRTCRRGASESIAHAIACRMCASQQGAPSKAREISPPKSKLSEAQHSADQWLP